MSSTPAAANFNYLSLSATRVRFMFNHTPKVAAWRSLSPDATQLAERNRFELFVGDSRAAIDKAAQAAGAAQNAVKQAAERLEGLTSAADIDNELISSRAIQSSVRLVLGGKGSSEVAKHAVSEGAKAVTKCNEAGKRGEVAKQQARRSFFGGVVATKPAPAGIGLSAAAGLQFPAEVVGSLATLLTGARVSKGAAVYLAATLGEHCHALRTE